MQRWEVCADLKGQEALNRYGRRERLISRKEYKEQRPEEAAGTRSARVWLGGGGKELTTFQWKMYVRERSRPDVVHICRALRVSQTPSHRHLVR